MPRACPVVLLLILGVACGGDQGPTGSSALPGQLIALGPLSQSGPVGKLANLRPAVQVLDGNGQPLGGVAVQFTADRGALSADAVTDGAGVARVNRWTLPSTPGPASITVRAGDLPEITFTAEVEAPGFDLEFRLLEGTPTAEEQRAFDEAKQILESVVWGDLPDEQIDSTPACDLGGGTPLIINERVDDLIVYLRIRTIDGPGGVGGSGTPCLIRDPGTQTLVGLIDLDVDDFGQISQPLKRDFVLHELMHVLGFIPGVINITTPTGFTRHCLDLPSQGAPNTLIQDSYFSCPGAQAAFDSIGGESYTGHKVPLENGATRPLGKGTLNHHWRQSTFGPELMTGWFTTASGAPLSLVTVRMLEDIGYQVSYASASPYRLTPPIATLRAGEELVQLIEPAEVPGPRVYRGSGHR